MKKQKELEILLDKTKNSANYDINVKNVMKFIETNQPKSLFRYRVCNEYSLDSFNKDTIYFNHASRFNDPYDCLVFIDNKKVLNEIDFIKLENVLALNNALHSNANIESNQSEFLSKIKEVTPQEINEKALMDILNTLKKHIKENFLSQGYQTNEYFKNYLQMACFSEDYKNPLMWSHYADFHKGFVLEYSTDSLQNACKDCNKICPNRSSLLLMPIVYTKNRYDATDLVSALTMKNIVGSQFGDFNLWKISDMLSYYKTAIYKNTIWKYEKEWRLFYINPNDIDCVYNIKPVAIYLGCRIKDVYKKFLITLAKEKKIKIYIMSENSDKQKYKLTAKELKY